MNELTLVIVDTTGIQNYIFGSNRLRENVGASHLVYLATQGWLFRNPEWFLPTPHNIDKIYQQIVDSLYIEQGDVAVEVLYAGGGNVAILFADPEDAKSFARSLSEKLLIDAPGLDAVLVSHPFKWDEPEKGLADAMKVAQEKLDRKKRQREPSQPIMGLGVTATCQSTGFDAHYEVKEPGDDIEPQADRLHLTISAEVRAKWSYNDAAKERLNDHFPELKEKGLEIPDRFDQLGRSIGDYSYIAVVHADGNGIGNILIDIGKQFVGEGGNQNRAYISALREFSDDVNASGMAALRAVVDKISQWDQRQERAFLSVRPIVFGGDDITFVCDGRIGLQAAQIFLEAFEQQKIYRTDRMSAAAGVAIVKVRYPFARAYALSEALCKNAKDVYERKTSALDWHMAESGLFGSLSEIRGREYKQQGQDDKFQSLLMHPLSVGAHQITKQNTISWNTWTNFCQLLESFRNRNRWPRNKVLKLRDALRQSTPDAPDSVQSYVTQFGELPAIDDSVTGYRRTG